MFPIAAVRPRGGSSKKFVSPTLNSPVGNTHSLTLSYTSSGNVNVLVLWVWADSMTTTSVSSPTYGAFTKRKAFTHLVGGSRTLELSEWWVAVAAGVGAAVAGEVITAVFSGGTPTGLGMIAAGVAGCSNTTPFDANASFPATATGDTSSAPTKTGLNSSSSKPLVVGLVGVSSNITLGSNPGTNFTYVIHEHSGNGGPDNDVALEKYAPSGALSNYTATWGVNLGEWAFLVDAFAPQ